MSAMLPEWYCIIDIMCACSGGPTERKALRSDFMVPDSCLRFIVSTTFVRYMTRESNANNKQPECVFFSAAQVFIFVPTSPQSKSF